MGEGGGFGGVDTHDEEGDEDHPEAGEEEQAAPGPVVGQRSQDLGGETTQRAPDRTGLSHAASFLLKCQTGPEDEEQLSRSQVFFKLNARPPDFRTPDKVFISEVPDNAPRLRSITQKTHHPRFQGQ